MENRGFLPCITLIGICLLLPQLSGARQSAIVWNDQEKPIAQQIGTLRSLPDDVRARTTKQLALQIRQLPAGANKLTLANSLANLSTEGDFGRDTLQEVTTTLAEALREHPVPEEEGPTCRAVRRTCTTCPLRAHASVVRFAGVFRGNGET